MLTLVKLSERIGLAGTIAALFVWLTAAAIQIDVIGRTFSPRSPLLAFVAAGGTVILAVSGGLVGFWLVANHVAYWRFGYRVTWLDGVRWVYEEHSADYEKRLLPYVREITWRGYPNSCKITIPSVADWEAQTPDWAQGRRDEIAERIANCHGKDQGANVRFVE